MREKGKGKGAIMLLLAVGLTLPACAQKDPLVERRDAYAAYRQGDYAEAAAGFAALVEETPADAELWFRLGNAQARSLQPRKAVESYENALLRNPGMAKAWYNKGLIHVQEALKTYAEMQAYVPADSPIGLRAAELRAGLLQLLDGVPGGQEGE